MVPNPLRLIFNCVVTYMLALYANPQFPIKIVQDFMDFFINFIKSIFLANLQKEILEILSTEDLSKVTLHKVNKCFENYSKVFDCLKTEDQRKLILKQKGFIDSEIITIGTIPKETIVDNKTTFGFQVLEGIRVPLRKSLKVFLEIPNIFIQILDYMDELTKDNDLITNIIQADLWIRKYSHRFTKEIILPLYLFYDDLEVGNCLGSH